MKILVIGDFHYKKMMYPPTISNLSYMLNEASDCDIIIHTGDFCNDYLHSPELITRLMADGRDYFGVYGNHELETVGNTMRVVTPLLTNAHDKVVFGTTDGKNTDGSIGYYYCDREGYRFIFLDCNYSLTPHGEWEHNREASWGPPSENLCYNALGAAQVEWLEKILIEASDLKLKCIVITHAAIYIEDERESLIFEAEQVRQILSRVNSKRQGTVIACINGHYHTSSRSELDGVIYLNCPAAINAYWTATKFFPYAEKDVSSPQYLFDYEEYDSEGNLIEVRPVSYSELSMGSQSLFYKDPIYTVLTLNGSEITEKTSSAELAYGISY